MDFRKKKLRISSTDNSSIIKEAVEGLLIAIREAVRFIGRMLRPIAKLLATILTIILIVFAIGVSFGFLQLLPWAYYIHPDEHIINYVAAFNVIALIVVVLLGLARTIIRAGFGYRSYRSWKWELVLFFGFNVLSLVGITAYTARQFEASYSSSFEKTYPDKSESVHLALLPTENGAMKYFKNSINIDLPWVVDEGQLSYEGAIQLNIQADKSGEQRVKTTVKSRGKDQTEAMQIVERVSPVALWQGEDTLAVSSKISIPHGEKFRMQRIAVDYYLPVGHTVTIDPALHNIIHHVPYGGAAQIWQYPEATWKMTEQGLICLDCKVETADEVM